MADLVVCLDMGEPPGQRLAPEVQTEIEFVAPSVVDDGAITTAKLHDKAVTTAKLNEGAVTSPKIGTGEVKTANIGPEAVTTAKLAADSVTADKAGAGVMTAQDAVGNDLSLRAVPLTAAQYAALSPDPNTIYLITT